MLNISKEEFYKRLSKILKQHDFVIEDRRDFKYFIQFLARVPGGQGMVKIYQGKKGSHAQLLNCVGSGESLLHTVIAEMMGELPYPKGKHEHSIPAGHLLDHPHIGTDESGKGDFFGPLVVAAVYVTPEDAVELAAAGIRDCKLLSDTAVLAKGEHILKNTISALVVLPPEEYNARYAEVRNLNKLLAWCHAQAIEDILNKVDCEHVLTDQFGDRRLIEHELVERRKSIILEQRPRAEENIAVAAASVLARAKFLDVLRELSEEYGVTFPKGASSQVDAAARDFVHAFGKSELRKVAKLHFKNAAKIT
jgi:ribonuclease HIII